MACSTSALRSGLRRAGIGVAAADKHRAPAASWARGP